MADLGDHNPKDNNEDNKDVKDNEDSKLDFNEDEENLVARMFSLVGERWALIAGRIPGRTAEEIEKYWISKYGSGSSSER